MDKQNGPTNPANQGEPNLKDQSMVEKDSNLELLNLMNNNDNSQVIAQPTVISKLKAQNQHLEQELQNLRYQLRDTIEKKKTSRKMAASTSNAYSSNFRSTGDGSPEGERISELQKELATVHKEMDNYKKEIKALQLRFSNIPVEKYEEAGNKFSEKQVELKCLELERKTLEKTLKEKNKLFKELQEISERANSHREPSSMPVEEELKTLKSKVKEAQKKEQVLEKEAQKSNQHVLKLLEELGKYKEDYRRLLTKTGYDPVEDRIKPPTKIAASPIKSQIHTARPHLNIVLKTREDSDIQSPRMEVNEKNFNKLKEEYREHKKTEAQKQRTSKLKVGKLKETLVEIDREKDETLAKVADKEKEAGILRNRTRELYRALLSHGLLPPGKDYESLFRERTGFTSPQDKKKMNQNRSLSVGLRKISRETRENRENRESREVKKVQIKQIQNIRKSDLSNSSILLPKYTPGKETPVRDTLAQESIRSPGKETSTPIRDAPEKESPGKGGKEPVVKEYYLENYPIQQKIEVMPTLVTKGMVLKGYRVDDIGHRVEKESTDFNDQEKVGENIVRICHVRVWYDNDGIAGLQAGYHVYQNKEHQVIEGDEHVIGNDKYKVIDVVLQNGDYLKSVSGYTNAEENVIECLNFYSENGEAVTVGKNKNTSKMFKFDINDLEFPAIFHGSIRSVKKGKGSVLCRLGVLIKVDAVEEDIEKVDNNPNNVAGKKRNLPKTNLTLQSPK